MSRSISETAQDPEPEWLCTQLFRLSPDSAQIRLSNPVAQDLARVTVVNHWSSSINGATQDPEPERLCTQLPWHGFDIAQKGLSKAVAQNPAQLGQIAHTWNSLWERLHIWSRSGCGHKCSGSSMMLHRTNEARRWLKIWLGLNE